MPNAFQLLRRFAQRLTRFGSYVFAICPLMAAPPLFAADPNVTVLYSSGWSPGDVARDGAAEFEVLMCAARLRSGTQPGGLVGVGNRRGTFPPAAEMALERVALMGIPVVRLAQGESMPTHSGDLFIEAGSLSAAEAQRLLASCLTRYGALPAAADPLRPTKKERTAIQAKLARFQLQFDTHNASLVAMR